MILFALGLSGCSSPPDVPLCRELLPKVIEEKDIFGVPTKRIVPNPVCMEQLKEPVCGRCTWTISDKTQYVGESKASSLFGQTWSQVKNTSLLTPSDSIAKIKAYIINECKKNGSCEEDITRWKVKLDIFSGN